MLQLYLNYPNSKISVHTDPTCGHIRQMGKPDQRQLRLVEESLEAQLAEFSEHGFASTAALNDMWVTIDLGDARMEENVLARISRTLGDRYAPFRDATVDWHC